MKEIQWISPQVSYSEHDNAFIMVFIPERNKRKMFLLFLWIFCWTCCGMYIILYAFTQSDRNWFLFGLIYLFFWLYFELLVLRVFHWRKWGKEVLVIRNGIIEYEKVQAGRKRIQKMDIHLAKECRISELNEKNWGDFFTTSFWHIGKPRLELEGGGIVLRFGFQLKDAEASEASKKINRFLKFYRNRQESKKIG